MNSYQTDFNAFLNQINVFFIIGASSLVTEGE